jgi:hypothetical protein
MRLETGIATLLCAAALPIGAQSVDPKLLLSPPTNAWLTYHGDYTGQRHALTGIRRNDPRKLNRSGGPGD